MSELKEWLKNISDDEEKWGYIGSRSWSTFVRDGSLEYSFTTFPSNHIRAKDDNEIYLHIAKLNRVETFLCIHLKRKIT
jgi:hypothetical protein